jgi:hypothetical protein
MAHPDPHFDELKKLLGCKRYEQPPPGYFFSFSDKVIARIEAEEAVRGSSWWAWLVERFDAKPVLVSAYGLAVSGLLFLGFRTSQVFDAEAMASNGAGGSWFAAAPIFQMDSPQALGQSAYNETIPVSLSFRSRTLQRQNFTQYLFATNTVNIRPAGFFSAPY